VLCLSRFVYIVLCLSRGRLCSAQFKEVYAHFAHDSALLTKVGLDGALLTTIGVR
jgi:hypothetical protein